jgi:hypothetical protein
MRSVLLWISSLWSSLGFWNPVECASLVVVVVAVAAEYVADIWKWPKDRKRRRRFSAWAGILLIVGLAVELLATSRTISISGKEIAVLGKAAADADEHAAEANKSAEDERIARIKLEGIIASRSMSGPEMNVLFEKAKRFAGQKVDIFVFDNSWDSSGLRAQIETVLVGAEWKVHTWFVVPNGIVPIGVRISVADGSDKRTTDAADTLVSCLDAPGRRAIPGIPFHHGPLMDAVHTIEVRPFGNLPQPAWDDTSPASIRILIGSKENVSPKDADDIVELLHRIRLNMDRVVEKAEKDRPKPKK